jgi:hypothetical protein
MKLSLNTNGKWAIAASTVALMTSVCGPMAAQSLPETTKPETTKTSPSQQETIPTTPAGSTVEAPAAQETMPTQPMTPTTPEALPVQPVNPTTPEALPTQPMAPTAAPEAMPTTPMAPAAAPEVSPTESIPMPTSPQNSPQAVPTLPELRPVPTEPASPRVSTTSDPSTGAVPAATTMVLPQESITGITSVDLPASPPIQAGYFTLPIVVQVAKDPGLTSSTPISDRYTSKESWDINAWASAVSSCLQQKPKLVRVVGEEQVPFMLNGSEGTIMLNSSDKAVCPM